MADRDSVTRYIVSHMGRDGMRIMTQARQGRHTYATVEEAKRRLDAMHNPATGNDLGDVFGAQCVGTFLVQPIECYRDHFDPKAHPDQV